MTASSYNLFFVEFLHAALLWAGAQGLGHIRRQVRGALTLPRHEHTYVFRPGTAIPYTERTLVYSGAACSIAVLCVCAQSPPCDTATASIRALRRMQPMGMLLFGLQVLCHVRHRGPHPAAGCLHGQGDQTFRLRQVYAHLPSVVTHWLLGFVEGY